MQTTDHRRLRYIHENGEIKNPDEIEGRTEPITKDDVVNLKIALETEKSLRGFLKKV